MKSYRWLRRQVAHLLHLTRGREVALLQSWLERTPGRQLLDLGCGDGYWTSRLGQVARVRLGVDIDENNIFRAHTFYESAHVAFVLGNAERLPLADQSTDRATCVCALQNFGDPIAALRELARVMKPGGLLALSVDSLLAPSWVSEDYRRYHAARFNTGRVFDLKTLTADLDGAGFIVLEHRWLLRNRWAAFWAMQQERFGWSVNWWFPLSIPLSRLFDRLTPFDQPGLILTVLAKRV
jgi:SAM-dependent methyltransferase